MPMNKYSEFEAAIGYRFRDRELLLTALRHSSYLNEHGLPKYKCNERLEFLGDAVLEKISSHYLYELYPESMEGELSKKRAALVCEASLSEAAVRIGLPEMLILGRGADAGGGRSNPSIVSDAFEALIAAIYLDGGEAPAEKLVRTCLLQNAGTELAMNDYKSALQELVQKQNGTVSYKLLQESGPDHRKHFTVRCMVNGQPGAEGTSGSIKEAEQSAARATIEMIRNETLCI